MKRLSALAQLVALYAECKGIIKTVELAKLTGRTERQIWRAKAELDDTNDTDKDVSHPDVSVRVDTDKDVSHPDVSVRVDTDINVSDENPLPPQRKVSPWTPSKENTPSSPQNLPSVDFVSADAAAESEEPSAGKRYVFEGLLIRVTERDFERWREAYPNVTDLTAELRLADAYYAERPEKLPGGKWFFAVSRWLDRANKKPAAGAEEFDRADPYYAKKPDWVSVAEWHRICPPEIYRGLQ